MTSRRLTPGEVRPTSSQRDQLMALFNLKFRGKPLDGLMPEHKASAMAEVIAKEIADTIECRTAMAWLEVLKAKIANMYSYDATAVNFTISSNGSLAIPFQERDWSDTADDLVNTEKRARNKIASEHNSKLREAADSAIKAWEVEQAEKLTVIRTAATMGEILMLVPECRVMLPTNADRELLEANGGGYRGGLLASGTLEAEVLS